MYSDQFYAGTEKHDEQKCADAFGFLYLYRLRY